MRHIATAVAMLAAANAFAAENLVAKLGLKDGTYCSKDGLRITVAGDANPAYVGIMALECRDPKLAGGRLTAGSCATMSGNTVPFEASFRSTGDEIVSGRTSYRLTPPQPGKLPCEALQAQATLPPADATADSGWSTWFHNGSTMVLNEKTGRIAYSEPRAAIVGAVRKGTVLFEGRFEGKRVSGTAYVFKKGCEPAPYPVSGRIEDNPRGFGSLIVLTGLAPKRDRASCAIVGTGTAHSRLVFEEYGDL